MQNLPVEIIIDILEYCDTPTYVSLIESGIKGIIDDDQYNRKKAKYLKEMKRKKYFKISEEYVSNAEQVITDFPIFPIPIRPAMSTMLPKIMGHSGFVNFVIDMLETVEDEEKPKITMKLLLDMVSNMMTPEISAIIQDAMINVTDDEIHAMRATLDGVNQNAPLFPGNELMEENGLGGQLNLEQGNGQVYIYNPDNIREIDNIRQADNIREIDNIRQAENIIQADNIRQAENIRPTYNIKFVDEEDDENEEKD